MTVTNLGPTNASNVILTNAVLSPSTNTWVTWGLVSPTNLTVEFTNGTALVSLGTLTNQAVINCAFAAQATNAMLLTLYASVGSADVPDPNLTNNVATTNVLVTNALPGILVANFASPLQAFNPQNGLMEQVVVLSNVGPTSVASSRVVVSGLTATNWLFNAAGTNNSDPFVVYAAPLNTNQSVNLLLQYFVPTGLPFTITTNQLQALEVPAYDLTPPSNLGTNIAISDKLQLPSGRILIEFPSVTNAGYTVVYSDNATFTNSKVALPSITAPADRVQWIDYGPPGTISLPAGTNSRFYKVYLNP